MRSLPISAILKAKRSLARSAQGPPTADEEDDLERSDRVAAAREKLAEMMRKKRGEGRSGGKEAEKEEEVNGWKAGRQERERREKVKRADKHAYVLLLSFCPLVRDFSSPIFAADVSSSFCRPLVALPRSRPRSPSRACGLSSRSRRS